MSDEVEYRAARSYALRRISKQALPTKSLVRSLERRGISPETIQRVIVDFETHGFLNDLEWSKSFVRTQRAKKVGPRAIAQKLAAKGFGREEIAKVVQEDDTAESQSVAIAALLATRYRARDLSDYKERGKVIASLMRRGFDFDEIMRIVL